MNKTKLLLFTTLLPLSVICHGQGQRLGGPSAEAKTAGSPSASQGMGSLYSPNLYDGSANINIPIYQYSVENNDFGISFGYNTKGIKVDLIASDIGLGWTLNAGSGIRRVQKDLPDEINLIDGDTLTYLPSNAHPPSTPYPGYTPAQDDTIPVNRFWAFKGKYATYFESSASAADELVYRDKEADDFVVTLGSGTFTFNLGKNGTIFTHPHRNVSVEVLWGDQPLGSIADQQVIGSGTSNLLNFRIRDEQGNTYTFARSDYKNTTIYDPYGKSLYLTGYQSTSSWVVSKVKLASGAEINYHYQPLQYLLSSLPPNKNYSVAEGYYPSCSDAETYSDYFNTSKLLDIQYPNGIIVYFNYDSRFRLDYRYGALREIRVASSTQCLSYILKQSFFNTDPLMPEKPYTDGLSATGSYTPDRKLRLKLNGILLNSCDSSVQEPYYYFTYDETILPERLSNQQDYFGYYKAGTSTPYEPSESCNFTTAIPYHERWIAGGNPNNVHYWYGFDKTPRFPSMKAAILKSVTNAYFGSVSFYYGPHTGIVNVLNQVPSWDSLYLGENDDDGLRLDSIRESGGFVDYNFKVTTFEYSGGQRFLQGGYFHYTSKLNGNDSTATEKLTHIITGSFLTPHQLVNGSNHGYSQVNVVSRVTTGITTGALLSRKEIKFSNFSDDLNAGVKKYIKTGSQLDFFTYPFTDKQYLMDWAMGLPLEVTEYDQNNRIVQKTINKYKYTLDTTSAIGKVDNQKIALIPVSGWRIPGVSRTQGNKSIRDFYHPFTGAALLDTTIVRKYLSDNVFVADTVRYSYDGRNNLSSIYTRNSKGQVTLTTQAYNYTLNSSLGSPLQIMTQAGLEKLVGTERWILGSGTTENKLVDAYFNTFEYQNGKLKPKYLYNFQHGSPLTYSQYTGYTGGPNIPEPFANVSSAFAGVSIPYFVKTSEVTLADPRGNPLETRMLGQNLYKSMIWDTLTGQKIAEANARYSDIAYTGFEATVKGNWEYNAAGVNIINSNNTMAGGKSYYSNYGPVSRSGLTADKAYIVAFWASNNSTAPSCTIGSSAVTLIPTSWQGNWTYYEGRFTAPSAGSVLSVSAPAGNYLDELRLFPADASMQSWSYKGMFGLSAVTDATGRLTYYEYDKMGRQVIVRDQEGNILGKTEHHVSP